MRAWLIALLFAALTALPAAAQEEVSEEETTIEETDVEVSPEGVAEETDLIIEEETVIEEDAADEDTAEEGTDEEEPMEEEVVEDTTLIPFGLKWGMHPGQLSSLDIEITDSSRTNDLTVVTAEEIPDAFAETKSVNLLFDRRLGLVKVRWTSLDIEADPTGTTGRAKYGEMRAIIMDALGEPTDETLVVGARLFDQEDEFYQCLAYEGCGVWSALWENSPSGGVLLSVEGTGPGQGFVQIDYESANWQDAADQAASAAEAPPEN